MAVKNNGMYIAVAFNKATGKPVNKRIQQNSMILMTEKRRSWNKLTDTIYDSSVGLEELLWNWKLSKSRTKDPENKLDFKTANFENNICCNKVLILEIISNFSWHIYC